MLFHCGAGRDRTGLVAALPLSPAGVTHDAIVADYLASSAALRSLAEAMGRPSEQHLIDEALQKHGHTIETALREVLGTLDASAVLERGGLDDADRAAARAPALHLRRFGGVGVSRKPWFRDGPRGRSGLRQCAAP